MIFLSLYTIFNYLSRGDGDGCGERIKNYDAGRATERTGKPPVLDVYFLLQNT